MRKIDIGVCLRTLVKRTLERCTFKVDLIFGSSRCISIADFALYMYLYLSKADSRDDDMLHKYTRCGGGNSSAGRTA